MRGSRFHKDEIVLKKEVRELEVVKNKPMKNSPSACFIYSYSCTITPVKRSSDVCALMKLYIASSLPCEARR